MTPLPHHYRVALHGGATGYGTATSPRLPDLRTAPPVDFDGPGDAWTPEHLLLAAVETCFLFTLRAVARASKIDVLHVDLDVIGTVDRQDGVTRFTEIVLSPTVTVRARTPRERAMHIVEKAERACLVSASLVTPVRLHTTIVDEVVPLSA